MRPSQRSVVLASTSGRPTRARAEDREIERWPTPELPVGARHLARDQGQIDGGNDLIRSLVCVVDPIVLVQAGCRNASLALYAF